MIAVIAVTVILVSSGGSKPPFITFRDPGAGFNLTYPSAWTVTKPNDPNVHLLLDIGVKGLDTLLVRPIPIQTPVDTSNVANIKAVTDAVISGTPIIVTFEHGITINGLPGYYYVYKLPVTRRPA